MNHILQSDKDKIDLLSQSDGKVKNFVFVESRTFFLLFMLNIFYRKILVVNISNYIFFFDKRNVTKEWHHQPESASKYVYICRWGDVYE